MLSKTRTTIITLVAAFSFGGAAVVPTVAQAKPKKKGTHLSAQRCRDLKAAYNVEVELAKESTTYAEWDYWSNAAFATLNEAEQGGCSWAKAREQTITGVRPEGGPPQIAPESGRPPPHGVKAYASPPPAR